MNWISAGGIIWQGDKICFLRYPDGKLSFPKGTQEPGETIEQTAIREVQEETGLNNPRIIKKLGILTRVGHDRKHQPVLKDIHLYLMEVDDFTQGKKDEEIDWLTPDEAFPRLFPAEAEFLKKILTA